MLSKLQNLKERVIAFGSKVLSKEEKNYCVTRRELLAVVHFVKHYRQSKEESSSSGQIMECPHGCSSSRNQNDKWHGGSRLTVPFSSTSSIDQEGYIETQMDSI